MSLLGIPLPKFSNTHLALTCVLEMCRDGLLYLCLVCLQPYLPLGRGASMESREEGSWTVRLGYRERNRQNRDLPCTTSEDDYVHHDSQLEDDNREDSSYKFQDDAVEMDTLLLGQYISIQGRAEPRTKLR
jgi:hypothetical protein